jgi:hypothetical protein
MRNIVREQIINVYTDFVSRVEAGWNTCTVALRVVESNEKGTRCLGVLVGNLLIQVGGLKEGNVLTLYKNYCCEI